MRAKGEGQGLYKREDQEMKKERREGKEKKK